MILQSLYSSINDIAIRDKLRPHPYTPPVSSIIRALRVARSSQCKRALCLPVTVQTGRWLVHQQDITVRHQFHSNSDTSPFAAAEAPSAKKAANAAVPNLEAETIMVVNRAPNGLRTASFTRHFKCSPNQQYFASRDHRRIASIGARVKNQPGSVQGCRHYCTLLGKCPVEREAARFNCNRMVR